MVAIGKSVDETRPICPSNPVVKTTGSLEVLLYMYDSMEYKLQDNTRKVTKILLAVKFNTYP